MNEFQDLEHALLTGVVLGELHGHGVDAVAMANNVDDATPYLRIKFDSVEAVIVVMPPNE